ncbi:hypothetical protein ACE193_15290 [Bernardetia sp. OM2101]|uniref:hypothetical protein n=1 Tax=Bernardetia sp. OM2101 TaxID=3344876 RepID=UPI0035D0C49D
MSKEKEILEKLKTYLDIHSSSTLITFEDKRTNIKKGTLLNPQGSKIYKDIKDYIFFLENE